MQEIEQEVVGAMRCRLSMMCWAMCGVVGVAAHGVRAKRLCRVLLSWTLHAACRGEEACVR